MNTVCPFHDFSAEFDPLDLTNPFPLLAAAQAEEPIFYSPAVGYWVVTRHEDIKAIFRDHESFTAENTITPIVPFSDEVKEMLVAGNYTPEPVLSNNVPPKHTRIRGLVNKLFTPRRMAHFAPAIRDVAQQFIERFAELGEVDIVAALTYEFPAQVLFHVLGVPAADVPQVKAWAGNRIKLYYGRPTAEEQIAMTGNLVPFWRYVVNLVATKAADPADDLTSDLIRLRAGDDAVLTLNEIASCMITLLVAGHETTTSQITNGLLHWLSQPGEWARLCQEPKLIAAAVEEMLRFDPSVNTWRRLVRRPATVGGVDIPAGANLLLMLNAANRDPAIFPEPDKIDVSRANLKEHLAFGYGIHYCVGAPLARLEMMILFEELTGRFPNLSLVPDQPISYVPNISFRGPQKLMVRW